MTTKMTDLVNRFLTWPVPADVYPDGTPGQPGRTGTNLMNDRGPQPLNVVMKMVKANGQPVAKISDEAGKTHCKDPNFVAYLRHVFQVPAQPGKE